KPPDLRSSSSIPCFARLLRVCTYELLVVFLASQASPRFPSGKQEAVDDQFQLRQIARMRYIYVEEEFESEQEDFEEDQDGLDTWTEFVGEMLTSYSDDHLTKSSKRNVTTDDLKRKSKKKRRRSVPKSKRSNEGVTTDPFSAGDLHRGSNQSAEIELNEEEVSNLSKSVVSIALFDGHIVLFACSGIAVERVGCVTRFFTTASLVKALNDNRKGPDNLKIEVRHEDNVAVGFLGEYDLDHNVAAVNVKDIPDLRPVPFTNMLKKSPLRSKVISLGRDISGKLMVTSGTRNGDSKGPEYKLTLSTCKMSKDCEGGPLFGSDRNFIGMNLSIDAEGTIFLPTIRIFQQLTRCKSLREIEFPAHVGERLTRENSNSHQEDVLSNDLYGDLESLGYPDCPKLGSNDDMVLVNSFEDNFGDIFGTGVWSELSETVANNICENTVALASFNGEKRLFACTGFFIDWNGCTAILTSASLLRNSGYENKIVENLRIEVLLNNRQRVEGTLQHYNLHYNVALVSVKDSCAPQPAKIQHQWRESCELLAVGRNFTSGSLMGARGRRFPMVVTYDCRFLEYSRCRISKAGIGGPLLTFDGKFIGMNFYDEGVGGTPFLSWSEILDVLEHFKTKRTVAEVGHDTYSSNVLDWTIVGDPSVCPNRWPVPKPYWCRRNDLDKREYVIQTRRPQFILY
ncbi:hypothetical protein EJB05_18117, partial [Eragrostis curvula]